MASLRLVLCALLLVLGACGGGGGDSSAAPPAGGAPPPPPPPAGASADLTLTVADTLGRFVDAASVTVGSTGTSAATDAAGKATLKVPVGSEQVLTVAKAGFAEQVRVVALGANATAGGLEVLLVEREPAQTIATIEAGGSATGKHGVKVEFPAAALVDANGSAVSGTIDMLMTPLNTALVDVGAFPGAFEGTAPGVARSAIVTFGTAELVPQQGGKKLQLATGKTATIELPMYATTLLDGTPIKVGDTIPLWSLNSGTGIWAQEGTGTVVARAASPTRLALRATIGHFSWWNVDQFAQRGTVNITVNATGVTAPAGTLATVQAQVVSGNGPTSTASVDVAVGASQSVQVAAPATLTFSTRFDVGNLTCSGSVSVSATPDTTVNATLNATCVEVPVPTIVAPADLSATNCTFKTHVQIVVNGPADNVELLVDGAVVESFGPRLFYVHPLDTAGFAEGTVSLQARATRSGSTRTGKSVPLVIDRTPPRATQFAPALTAQVSRTTTFTVEFDEPVNAVPFQLSDVVTLSVKPLGQSTPQAIDADIALDSAGLKLTVTPKVDLPLGTVGLDWGGLRDAASNAITGTQAASWSVDRSVAIEPTLSHAVFSNELLNAVLAIRADGTLLAVHKPTPGTSLALSRFDGTGNAWVTLASAINERPTQTMMAFTLDNNDVPHVAFVQRQAGNAATFELVLKRFNGTAMELAAPVVPLAGLRGNDISNGSMVFDGQNRAVITFSNPNDSEVLVFRVEQGSLVPLATIALGFDPRVALQPDGTPLIAYIQGIGGSNAGVLKVVRVANGTVQQLGLDIDSVPDATQFIHSPRIVMRGAEPWAFWAKNGFANAARFDGTSWIPQPFLAPVNGTLPLATALFNGDPLVASGEPNDVQVLRFHNGAWEPGFESNGRVGAARLDLAVRGTTAVLMTSTNTFEFAEFQRLLFP